MAAMAGSKPQLEFTRAPLCMQLQLGRKEGQGGKIGDEKVD